MINEYNTILDNSYSELVEKKSKFICNIFNIESEEDAKEKINKIKKENYDARHNVFAYIVLENEKIVERFSDDGEPSGTAGKPLLEILKQKNLVNVLVVVTRYFGGILLGTGGLLRAYSSCAILAMENSNIVEMINSSIFKIDIKYEEINKILHFCKKNKYIIKNIEYLDVIIVNIVVNYNKTEEFKESIKKILDRDVDISATSKIFVKK